MLMFFLMLYLLFFVLRDGDAMLEQMIRALPFGDERERALFNSLREWRVAKAHEGGAPARLACAPVADEAEAAAVAAERVGTAVVYRQTVG